MRLLKRLFAPKPKTQAHVVRRAVEVIDRVIFDVGIDTLVCGTFVLDRRLRVRFVGAPLARRRGVVAAVQVGDVAESEALRALAGEAIDAALVKGHCASLAHALVRELGHQAPKLRALPPAEAAKR
ncbi:hypothetical protein Q4S45_06975 [Massilia sp. R2A-15]|uniref:hypothetical protein n=1 Tax=Massilia sp. R2A-15 TaxID=3064278 RepID=UPI002734150A|nr:hypothetical protein [Massilia sp. R2A-15]WLI90852.1 hypothetical protein Q4S45_06975 [Massilia sp. R2A-15]